MKKDVNVADNLNLEDNVADKNNISATATSLMTLSFKGKCSVVADNLEGIIERMYYV